MAVKILDETKTPPGFAWGSDNLQLDSLLI